MGAHNNPDRITLSDDALQWAATKYQRLMDKANEAREPAEYSRYAALRREVLDEQARRLGASEPTLSREMSREMRSAAVTVLCSLIAANPEESLHNPERLALIAHTVVDELYYKARTEWGE